MFPVSNRSLALLLVLAVTSIACGSRSPGEPAPTPCSYTLSPSTLSFGASGGSGSVTVTTAANCTWTAASDRGWVSITGGASSTGTGVVSVNVNDPELELVDAESGSHVKMQVDEKARDKYTAAFDQYAVRAFELAAVDYLLKPFSRDRFLAAIERARLWIAAAQGEPVGERLREVSEAGYLTRLFVRDRGTVRPLRTSSVQHLESNDDYVTVHTAGGERFDMQITMAALEDRLDPASFLRIHRRFIVNLDHVVAIVPIV